MDKLILNECADLLIEQKLTLAFAESATAGRLASEFSLVKNAGQFLKGSLVCYDAKLKTELLSVSPDLIEKYTPESIEVTKAITLGLRKVIHANIHVGVTGLPDAGGSETEEKPVGTMFIYGTHNQIEIINEKIMFTGNPEEIVVKTVFHIADLLTRYLKKQNPS